MTTRNREIDGRVKAVHRELRTSAGAEIHEIYRASEARGRGILLVHGLASNARMWDGMAATLAELGHPSLAIDLRGHGRSSKPRPTLPHPDVVYDFPTMCLDLDCVLAQLNGDDPQSWQHPVIVGQSYGANLVLDFAASRPWAAGGVVCVDGGTIELSESFPDWESCESALAPPRIDSMAPDQLESHLRAAHPDWPETGIQGMLANFTVNAQGFVEPCLTVDRHLAILHHLWRHRPSSLYPRIKIPVLLVPAEGGSGGLPAELKKREIDAALSSLARAKVKWFTGDHDIHAQHPDDLAVLIHESIEEGFFS